MAFSQNSVMRKSDWEKITEGIEAIKFEKGKLILTAPYGIEDLVSLILRPIPDYKRSFKFDPSAFERRTREKKWLTKWPKLRIIS